MKLYRQFHIVPLLMFLWFVCINAQAAETKIDNSATAILKQMSDYLADLPQFSVNTQNTLEDLLASGHRIDLDVSAKVSLSRPNKLRSERKGLMIDQVFYYNGNQMTLFSPTHNLYATVDAPDTYFGLFKHLHEKIGFSLPIADLVHTDVYSLLMQDVSMALLIGETYINGVACNHLLFSRPGVDFQIWINKAGKPLPLKYVVTDTALQPGLSVSTLLEDWDVEPELKDVDFEFIPPEDSQMIEFILFN